MRKGILALALALALAEAAPVYAAGPQTVVTSEMSLPPLDEVPAVQVIVPQSGRIIINPYGLPTEIDGRTTTEQIAGETLTISNFSEVPVIVSAGAAGHISEESRMVFASVPPETGTEEKEVFLYAEFQNEDGLWSGSYTDGENQVLIFEGASQAKPVLTLEAGPSEGVFRMFGATTVSPAEPWSEMDEISVTFTFTFEPVIEAEEVPTLEGEQPAPEETPAPEEFPAPVETPTNGKNAAPEETPAPEEFPAPVETPTNGKNAAPVETPADGENAAPVETPADGENPAPVETPADGENPAPVETPAAGETPAPVETPANGESPAPVETPANGESPASVETPADGENAAPVETPANGETPAPEMTPAMEEISAPEETPSPEAAPQ